MKLLQGKTSLHLTILLMVMASRIASAQDVSLRPAATIYSDDKGVAINSPQGVAVDGKSMLAVADTGNRRVLLFDFDDEQVTPRSEIRLTELPYPTHLKIDSKGEILVLDGRKHQIGRVTPEGQFQGYLQLVPDGENDPVIPKSFELDDSDTLYVLDVRGGRVLVVSPDGTREREIAFPPEVGFLSDLAINDNGTLFAIDSIRRQILVARREATVLEVLADLTDEDVNFPTSITVDSEGSLYVADEYDGGILVFTQNGSYQGRQSRMGWKEGFLRYPADMHASGETLFVADRGNNRVQRFEIVR